MYNWFKIVLATSNVWAEQVIDPNTGGPCIAIKGKTSKDTFFIKDKIAALGFQWRGGPFWRMPLQTFTNNSKLHQSLQQIGIDISKVAPVGTVNTLPPIQPPTPPIPPIPAKKIWYAAERLEDKTIVAMSKDNNGNWMWVEENGNTGIFDTTKEIRSLANVLKNKDNRTITADDPKKVFEMLRNGTSEVSEKSVEQPKDTSGKIPPEKISKYQKAVENTFLSGKQGIVMDALAGAGKTSMLRHLASFKKPEEKWLYLVFAKKNQVEATSGKSKFPPGVEVLTSHAFLGRILGKNADMDIMPSTEIWNENGQRSSRIIDDIMLDDNTFPRQFQYAAKLSISKLTSLAKAFAINPEDPQASALLNDIAHRYEVDTDLSTEKVASPKDWSLEIIDKTLDVLHFSLPGNSPNQDYSMMRDHDDTLWYPALKDNLAWPKYDVVLADEVQDFNKCQMFMLKKLGEQGARIIAVGDPHQAVFRFRGADSQAFTNVQSLVNQGGNGVAIHELPENYRCGKNIIDYVNSHTKVNNLVAGRNFEGEVTEGIKYDDMFINLTKEWQQNGKLKGGAAFIARTNKPLVSCALDLLKADMNFVIIGRDFSQELTQHLEKITGKGRNAKTIPINYLMGELNNYLSNVEQKWKGKVAKDDELRSIRDNTDAINSIISHLQFINYYDRNLNMRINHSNDFVEYIKKRFAGVNVDSVEGAASLAKKDPRSYVTLTTAHRAKGLEFDRVFIIGRELFPHPSATNEEELEQEDNLYYVALTRAMNELHVLAPEENKKKRQ